MLVGYQRQQLRFPSGFLAPVGRDRSTGHNSRGSTGAPDPCSLLTTAEIDAATGLTFGDGAVNQTVAQENQTACDWQAADSGLGIVQVLVLTVDVFDTNRDSASEIVGVVDVSVPGAARAYATEDGSIVGMDMGGTYLQVSFLSADHPDVNAATLQLASAAAGRLG